MGSWRGTFVAWGAVLVCAAAAVAEEADDLALTDLQTRVLEQVFAEHEFHVPSPPPPDARFGVLVEPAAPGGVYRMGSAGDLPVRLRITARVVDAGGAVSLSYHVENFYGQKVAHGSLPTVRADEHGMAAADLVLGDLTAFGYYHVVVTAAADTKTATAACGVAVVHPMEPGAWKESPFGLLAPPGGRDADLAEMAEVARRLGVGHLALDWADGRHVADLPRGPLPDQWQPALRFDPHEGRLQAILRQDLVPTGLIDYGPAARAAGIAPGEGAAASAEDVLVGWFTRAGPPVVEHYASAIPHWHIGRAGGLEAMPHLSAAAARRIVSGLVVPIRRRETPVSLWVAAGPDFLASVLSEGPVLAGVDGVALAVDADARAPNLRSGAYRRSVDFGVQMARRMGVPRAAVGATGDDPTAGSPQRQAWKLVTRHVLARAAGAERVFIEHGRGLPAPLPSAAVHALLACLLDRAAYEGDLWPDVPLLETHLFSGPAGTVAVVWSWAGEKPEKPDRGLLVFEDGSGLEARDVVGHPVGIWKGRRLIVPLGEAPIYVASAEGARAVRERFRTARVVGILPATVWIRGLARGEVPGRAGVTVWVQSHRPQRLDAQVALLLPPGWRGRTSKQRFSLEPGEAKETVFECDVAEETGPGPHLLEAAADVDGQWIRRIQRIQPAQAPQRTIDVGGGLSDWDGIEPLLVAGEKGEPLAQVRAAWDDEFLYFSAAVRRPRETFRGGPFAFSGDAVQLGLGLADRADDDFGGRARGQALPAGAFRDTDHLMAIAFGEAGAQVVRLRGPRIALRAHLPDNVDPWHGPVAGSEASVAHDADTGTTVYEAAIPMAELAPLKAARGRLLRFAFLIGDMDGPPVEWARQGGVPDYLANPSSFLPVSAATLPCQTYLVLAGPRPKP